MEFTSLFMKTIVIGIGGPSCGGKSTLSNWLNHIFPTSCIVHQDVFFKKIIPKLENGLENWDSPEAMDDTLFIKHIISKKNQIDFDKQILSLNRPEMSIDDINEQFLIELKQRIQLIDYEFNIVLGN
jgi:nicotinamide/nicotinate riboside kinase